MSKKIRFILDNLADTTALTTPISSDIDGILSLDNIQDSSRGKVMRSINLDQLSTPNELIIRGVLPSNKSISSFVLGRHNFMQGVSWQIKLYSNLDYTGLLKDSGINIVSATEEATNYWLWDEFIWGSIEWGSKKDEIEELKNIVWWIVDANGDKQPINNVNSFEIVLKKNTASVMTYFELGRLFLADYVEPTYNISFGHGLTWVEKTKQYRSISGSLRSDIAVPYRKFEFDIKTISEVDRVIIQKGFTNVGLRKDFYVSTFPEDGSNAKKQDYSAIVKLVKTPRTTEFQNNWYRSKYIMEEV